MSIDREQRVVLVDFSGTLIMEDFAACDRCLRPLMAKAGALRCIVDMTGVSRFGLSSAEIVGRAESRPAMQGTAKIFVAPTAEAWGISRLFSAHRDMSGQSEPEIVRTLDEAFSAIGVLAPRFTVLV